MARNSAGKWVARAGATGGSRSYRGQAPINWYAALVVIVVLGVLSVVWASYQYRHPSTTTSTTQPTTSTTWYAGITFDVCGKTQPSLASNATSAKSGKGIFTTGSGVITVAPSSDKEAGKNAVLGKFVTGYPGLTLTATKLVLPAGKKSTSYKNGEACPKGTPDVGKKGNVQVVYWSSAFDSSAKAQPVTGDPSTLRFTNNQLITVGFVPSGTKLGKNATVVEALLHQATGSSTTTASTTTTAPATTGSTTTTAAPASTTTTAPATTTTAAPTTTTAKNAKNAKK